MTQLRPPRPNESPVNLVGARYGSLLVIAPTAKKGGRVYWRVRCDCGIEVDKRWTSIRDGQRCGRCTPIAHGHSRRSGHSTEYGSWGAMVQRCTNSNNPDFLSYGGRGIAVCARWLSFEKFLADMGSKPTAKHEIERVNNNRGYHKGNCIWATRKRQTRNRRDTIRVMWRGKRMSLADACDLAGIPHSIVKQRLRLGWSDNLALRTPRLEYGQRRPK